MKCRCEKFPAVKPVSSWKNIRQKNIKIDDIVLIMDYMRLNEFVEICISEIKKEEQELTGRS